ncbi:MAG: LLM class F420-dependent oxidoreductase [Candidatus Rokubacteria bacterium]|nr:LLM class F420-dependent oxidoreductase [Candidatus Rokubacteria bacterium]
MRKRWALSVPLDAFTLPEHGEIARKAEELGYADAWSFEADGLDAFSPLAVIGLASGLRLGTAIANVFTRGPATLAGTVAGLAEIAPGRVCLGIGSGSSTIVEGWNGVAFRRPATRVRETAEALRQILAGERVVYRGESVSVDGFRLSRPPAHPVPIYIAALRPGMLRVAGEVGDGVILNWLSAEDVPRSVAVVREAAVAAGRDPAAIEVTARLLVSLDPPGPEADVAVRRHITAYLNVPVYRAFQEWLGRREALAPMWDAWARGDRRAAVAAVPPGLMDQLMLRGTLAAIRAHVLRYLAAGIDTAFLQLSLTEPDPAKKRERILEAIRALSPGVQSSHSGRG